MDDFDPHLALKSVFDSFRLFLDRFIYLIRDQIRAFVNFLIDKTFLMSHFDESSKVKTLEA